MKLTKDQRYTMYCILLQEAEENEPFFDIEKKGICHLIRDVFGFYPISKKDYSFKGNGSEWFNDVTPELLKYENNIRAYWFKDWSERIEALKQCIKETENF